MADHDDEPKYTVYRSRPRLPWRRDDDLSEQRGEKRDEPKPKRRRRPITVGRVVKYVALALGAWLLLSLVLFLVSAQIESSKISDAAASKLSGGGFPLTSPNTILVLGSDARTKGTKEPGAQTIGQPSRSDSIMLLRIGGGANAQLSILRDLVVDIPGHGPNKINAAYAFGGPALAIQTVEQYLGIDINHIVEVNFANFPELIDALGGVTVKTGCVDSEISGGVRNGGYTLKLKPGTHQLNGNQALTLARTRKNACKPAEDDHARVRRQQQILTAMKDQVTSIETFFRLPWVSWAAPKAVRSDMSGPTLLGLVGAEMTGGAPKRYVLPDERQGVTVDDATKKRVVAEFLKG
jgi:LCP family protein required for cell wall assembly